MHYYLTWLKEECAGLKFIYSPNQSEIKDLLLHLNKQGTALLTSHHLSHELVVDNLGC